MGGNGIILLTVFDRVMQESVEYRVENGWIFAFFVVIALFGLWRAYAALGYRAAGLDDKAKGAEGASLVCFALPTVSIAVVMAIASYGKARGLI